MEQVGEGSKDGQDVGKGLPLDDSVQQVEQEVNDETANRIENFETNANNETII